LDLFKAVVREEQKLPDQFWFDLSATKCCRCDVANVISEACIERLCALEVKSRTSSISMGKRYAGLGVRAQEIKKDGDPAAAAATFICEFYLKLTS
jgi:hypothetical protein